MTAMEFLAKLQAEAERGFHKKLRAWVDDSSEVARTLRALEDLTTQTRTETQWGVRMIKDRPPFRKAGDVEWVGTKPSGAIGQFTEEEARYMARSLDAEVVKRTFTTTTEVGGWETA